MEILFSNLHMILPNATKYANNFVKKIPQNRIKQVFKAELQDCRGGSGLQFIKIDFWIGCPKIKTAILVKF